MTVYGAGWVLEIAGGTLREVYDCLTPVQLIQNNTERETLQTHLVNVFLEVQQNRQPRGSGAGPSVGRLEVLPSGELVTVCHASPGLLWAPVSKGCT